MCERERKIGRERGWVSEWEGNWAMYSIQGLDIQCTIVYVICYTISFSLCEWVRERERKIEQGREWEILIQIYLYDVIERERETHTHRQTERQTETERDINIDIYYVIERGRKRGWETINMDIYDVVYLFLNLLSISDQRFYPGIIYTVCVYVC